MSGSSSTIGSSGSGCSMMGTSVNLGEVKVVHFIRHGEAEHNVAAARHGRQAYRSWEFVDAPLTDKGREQARHARSVLSAHMKPQAVLVSPLTRALQTAEEIFKPMTDEEQKNAPRFEVWEEVRERMGQNPCDQRRKLSIVSAEFPMFNFARVQSEDDALWGDERESTEQLLQRAKSVIQMLRQQKENCIAVVSHSAFLTALFVVLMAEEGLKSNGNGKPDLVAASNPDTTPSPAPERAVSTNGQADPMPAPAIKKDKVYFTNGEVKSVVLLPLKPSSS